MEHLDNQAENPIPYQASVHLHFSASGAPLSLVWRRYLHKVGFNDVVVRD